MPLHWKIDSQQRLVTIVAEGDVTRDEFESCLDALYGADAHAYRKLFDGSHGDTKMPAEDIMALGVRMRATHIEGRTIGALAAVVPDSKIELVQRVLGMLAAADRPMRVFNTRGPAESWIHRQPRA